MRQSIPLLSLACLILFVILRVRGHSDGAPEESCDSLTVTHVHLGNPVSGTKCDPPCLSHQLRLMGSSADSFTYNCNQTYQLQLTLDRVVGMNPQESLNGYMVAPREDTGTPLGPDVVYVGSWELGTDMKLICDGQAVTQSKVLVDTVAVNMTWKAPMDGLQKVAFWFVVVPSTAFYYLPVKSLTATPNPAECSCPDGQCAMMSATDIDCVVPSDSLCSPGEVFNETECQCENCTSSIFCMNGGVLNTSTCTCDCPAVYSGPLCETCTRTCQNGGTLNEGACTCACVDGYSGDNCTSCALTCQNGGTLNEGTCTCDCADGYSGNNCTSCIWMCQNGGTLDEGSCTCACAGGFSGANCETCPLTCKNGGSLNGSTCTCDCTDGYSGDTCETCSRTCQNGTLDVGICMCNCTNSFSGSRCETCSLTCQNGGTLNAANCSCDCADGYSGATCGTCTRVCQNEGTLNAGTCVCGCAGSFSGPTCEDCIRMCQNGGTLDSGACTCACAGGFSGANCETSSSLVLSLAVGLGGGVVIVCIITAVVIVLVCIFKAKRGKEDSNGGDKAQLKGVLYHTADKQNPVFTDVDPLQLTTETQCEEEGGVTQVVM